VSKMSNEKAIHEFDLNGPEGFKLDIPLNRQEGERNTCRAFLEAKQATIDSQAEEIKKLKEAFQELAKRDAWKADKLRSLRIQCVAAMRARSLGLCKKVIRHGLDDLRD